MELRSLYKTMSAHPKEYGVPIVDRILHPF